MSDWSPDGTDLIATSDVGPDNASSLALTIWPITAAPRAEGHVRTLAVDQRYNLWQGRYSPDDRWVAFLAQRRDGTGVVVEVVPSGRTSASERDWTPITDQHWVADKPRWSPDGRMLYFTRKIGLFWNLWGRHFDPASGQPTGPPFQITHSTPRSCNSRPSYRPAKFAFQRNV